MVTNQYLPRDRNRGRERLKGETAKHQEVTSIMPDGDVVGHGPFP
jgi:hypothetical protein